MSSLTLITISIGIYAKINYTRIVLNDITYY
jgi:hypothetical protein